MLQYIVGYSNGRYTVEDKNTGKVKRFDTMKEALAWMKRQTN
jgi:hypothetical protein